MTLTTVKAGGIAADAIDETKIADNGIDSEHYNDGSIDHEHLANDAIDGDNLADNAVDSEHYTDGSIDHEHLAADCIDGDNIQDDVINSEHIAAGAIDLEHMSSESVDEDNLHISNAGSNGQFLSKLSGNSGGLTWASVSSTPEGEAILSTTNSNEASTKFLRADGDGTCSWQIPPAATATSGTDNFTISDGNLVIGTAGHGIDFSAHANASWGSGASTTTEILDHYEVGEFTPYIRGGGTDFDHTSTHGHREGDFVRVGELVHVFVRVGWNNTNSASGAITIRGFPFRCKSNSGGYYQTGSFSDFWGFFPNTYSIILMVGGQDYAYIHGVESEAALSTTNIGTGNGGFSFGFTYSTDD